jgi:hypothetical protein
MSFEAALKSHLSGDSGIAQAVGERIFPVKLPENTTKPAIVYTKVGTTPQTDLDSDDGDLLSIRLQVDCWATGFEVVAALAELVRLRMQAATITANSFNIGSVFGQDGYDPEAKLYRVTLDFGCWYRTA